MGTLVALSQWDYLIVVGAVYVLYLLVTAVVLVYVGAIRSTSERQSDPAGVYIERTEGWGLRWHVVYPSEGMNLETLHFTKVGARIRRLYERL